MLIKNWEDVDWIGFDLETSGKYPLDAEICEIAAVRWSRGQVVDQFQTLVRPSRPLTPEVIAIHGITNEMVEGAPSIEQVIKPYLDFCQDAFWVAHHAPFDMGFIAVELERSGYPPPPLPVFCSSLLSRRIFPESKNHRLQTLIDFFQLPKGQAHRALDDARACLSVALKCFERIGRGKSVEELLTHQGKRLLWESYLMQPLAASPVYAKLIEALAARVPVQIVYSGGSRPGEARTVHPMGLVRSPTGDFFVALDEASKPDVPKRYYLDRIKAAQIL